MGRVLLAAVFALFAFSMPQAAQANCTSPDAKEGAQEYFPADKIYKFCDGTNWVSFATASPGSGGGITVQFTTATYTGNLGGFFGANAKCQAEFPNSHFCTHQDFLHSGTTSGPRAWLDSPGGSYTPSGNARAQHSCAVWRVGSSIYRGVTTDYLERCSDLLPLACCTRQ